MAQLQPQLPGFCTHHLASEFQGAVVHILACAALSQSRGIGGFSLPVRRYAAGQHSKGSIPGMLRMESTSPDTVRDVLPPSLPLLSLLSFHPSCMTLSYQISEDFVCRSVLEDAHAPLQQHEADQMRGPSLYNVKA